MEIESRPGHSEHSVSTARKLGRPHTRSGELRKRRKKNPVADRNRNSVAQPAPMHYNWAITNTASGTVKNKPPLCSDW